MLETEVLIVGCGPAGLTVAMALARSGVRTVAITRYRQLSPTPRAHVTNQRTFEIFRDFGFEAEALARATPYPATTDFLFMRSLVGAEFARYRGYNVESADVEASPCERADLPQHLLEPILFNAAVRLGAHVRFSTESSPSRRIRTASPPSSKITSPASPSPYVPNISSAQTAAKAGSPTPSPFPLKARARSAAAPTSSSRPTSRPSSRTGLACSTSSPAPRRTPMAPGSASSAPSSPGPAGSSSRATPPARPRPRSPTQTPGRPYAPTSACPILTFASPVSIAGP